VVTVGEEIASKSKFGRCGSGSFEFSVAVPSRKFKRPDIVFWMVCEGGKVAGVQSVRGRFGGDLGFGKGLGFAREL